MKPNGRKNGGSGRDSIALSAILQHIDAHPEVLRPINGGIVGSLHARIEGVEVDRNQRLPSELNDAGMP